MTRLLPTLLALCALALILFIGCYVNAGGAFFSAYTHSSTLGQIAGFTILASGLTLVILTGGIDLSVGSLVALSGVIAALLARDAHFPGPLAALLGIAAAGLCGLTSGITIAYLRLQPFIATLAMMAFARGLAKRLSENTKIVMLDLPSGWEFLDAKIPIAGDFFLPSAIIPAAVCAVLTLILLRFTTTGLAIYATGDNEQAARYAGIPVARTKILAYTLSGLFAGLAGITFAAREHQANPDGGVGYELTAIAMVVIGGTSLSGGRGDISLTILGALTIGYLQKILDINGLDPAQQLMITGAIIFLAVLLQGLQRRS